MGEPFHLRPFEIDRLTLEQVGLYFGDDEDDEVTHADAVEHIRRWRQRQGYE